MAQLRARWFLIEVTLAVFGGTSEKGPNPNPLHVPHLEKAGLLIFMAVFSKCYRNQIEWSRSISVLVELHYTMVFGQAA